MSRISTIGIKDFSFLRIFEIRVANSCCTTTKLPSAPSSRPTPNMDAEPTTTAARTGSADAGPSDGLVLEVRASKLGRTHGKAWKGEKAATRRSTMPKSLKSKFEERMEKEKARKAVLAVEKDMKEESKAEKER